MLFVTDNICHIPGLKPSPPSENLVCVPLINSGRDCSKHKKKGLERVAMLEQCWKPSFSFTPLPFLSRWWCVFVLASESCIVHSHAPDPLSMHTHTNVHALAPTHPHAHTHGHTHKHTHTKVRGKSIHSCLASCTLFHLVPNHEWSLIQAWNLSKDWLSMTHTHTHAEQSTSQKCLRCLAVAYHTCSNCQSDCAVVRQRGRVPHYGSHCACASFRRSWGGKPAHCGIE